jgi:predicted RNase H-like nuclease (RuvC/YqgF family)
VTTRTEALDSVVYGVDVQQGDVRGSAPSYALVRFDGEAIDRNVVTGRKLRRLIEEAEPAIVATDNVYELAADRDDLVSLLRDLPAETRLVQVTGAERPEPLSRVAHNNGVPYDDDPMSEAEAAARLAAGNVGQVVSAFTDTTRIEVSRGRSTGKGGWSEDRHTRRMHGAVKRRAREIESTLDAAGLEYDREATEKYGGFSSATFTVEASPEEIPVSTGRGGDVRVEMERQRRDGIEFSPLARRRDHVVVGVDPGTTTAVAVCSLEGDVLDVWSTRTADASEVIEWLVERGRPILVAADVTPMPDTVEKLRRSFDAVGWTPSSDLPVDEKLHRTRNHGTDNDHERDALAAALFALDDHEDLLDRVAGQVPPNVERGPVARAALDGQAIDAAIAEQRDGGGAGTDAAADAGTPDGASASDGDDADRSRVAELLQRVERLEGYVEALEDTVEEKDECIDELESRLEAERNADRAETRERREVSRLRRETERLERERDEERERVSALEDKLDRMKTLWKLDHSNFADVDHAEADLVPVKPVAKFTDGAIADAQEAYGIAPEDVVYLRDATGAGRETAERLADLEPRVVLCSGGLSDAADGVFFERAVPSGPAADVAMQEVDDLAVARESDVEAVIDDWEARYEERKREQNASMVDELISEHRAERSRSG